MLSVSAVYAAECRSVRSLVGFCFVSFRNIAYVEDHVRVNYDHLRAVFLHWLRASGSVGVAQSRTETTQSGCACVPSVSRAPTISTAQREEKKRI